MLKAVQDQIAHGCPTGVFPCGALIRLLLFSPPRAADAFPGAISRQESGFAETEEYPRGDKKNLQEDRRQEIHQGAEEGLGEEGCLQKDHQEIGTQEGEQEGTSQEGRIEEGDQEGASQEGRHEEGFDEEEWPKKD
ncbi:MAG: hypothetical protein MK085_03675 [Phycisphaerales bacterium]|nr:hypothetical protein [Phycisphaerales bacterium]